MLFSMNIFFDILFGGHAIYALKTQNGEQSECHCFFTKSNSACSSNKLNYFNTELVRCKNKNEFKRPTGIKTNSSAYTFSRLGLGN